MKNKKNILIDGFFGHKNLGDDLLLLQALQKIPIRYNLFIMWPRNAIDEVSRFSSIRPFTPVYNWKEALKNRYSALIYSGGGLFPSLSFGCRGLLGHLKLGLTSRKKILNGVGIAPKTKRLWFDFFLRTFDYISVRDELSREFVSTSYPSVVNCGDLYWGASCNGLHVNRITIGGGKNLLICLANPFSDEERENIRIEKRHRLLVSQMAKIISDFKNEGYVVDYLPFYHGSDEKIIADVQRCLNSKDRVLECDKDYTLQNIDKLFASYDIGICMRFHSVLLAVKNSLPCLAICYDHKSEQLLKEAGLSSYGVRYGIRTSQFFGEERDLDTDAVNRIMKGMKTDTSDFKRKSKAFAAKKMASVNDNYRTIFEEVLSPN